VVQEFVEVDAFVVEVMADAIGHLGEATNH